MSANNHTQRTTRPRCVCALHQWRLAAGVDRWRKIRAMQNTLIFASVLISIINMTTAQNLSQQSQLGFGGSDRLVTLTISSDDVIQQSLLVFRRATNVFVKFQYTEAGSNKVRAFYESHQGEMARIRIGTFATPPFPVNNTNTAGRDGFWGLPEKDANAVLAGLKVK